MKKPMLIAEIGCNHKGDLSLAKEFIRVANEHCKVNVVKFQKREPREVLSVEEYNASHQNPSNSYGKTYGEHREFLEFSLEQHKELKRYCEDKGLTYSCSVWDMISVREIVSLQPNFIKVPSATNTHFELLDYLCRHFSGKLHISLGMTTLQEERLIVEYLEERNRLKDTVIYACTSGYPVPPEDVCLLEIKRLCQTYGDRVHAIGFSGHHNGIAIDVAAYMLGATYIERHFTLDRTWKGTDHAASLEPLGLLKLNRDLLNIHKASTYKTGKILEIEKPQRNKLKWNRNEASAVEKKDELSKNKKIDLTKISLVLMDVDGVLTDSGMYYTNQGDELKKFNTRDGQGIALLQKAGIKTGIITSENTKIVTQRAAKLNVDYLFQGVTNKLKVIEKLLDEHNQTATEVCYIGDDINDLEALEFSGYAVAPKDATFECRVIADYVCKCKGGEGCVREIANMLLVHKEKNG